MYSAFGIDHGGEISKKKDPSGGRVALGSVAPGWHGAIAGKKGKKLRAVGNEVGGNLLGGAAGGTIGSVAGPKGHIAGALAGGYAGGAAGTVRAHRKGHYKKQS